MIFVYKIFTFPSTVINRTLECLESCLLFFLESICLLLQICFSYSRCVRGRERERETPKSPISPARIIDAVISAQEILAALQFLFIFSFIFTFIFTFILILYTSTYITLNVSRRRCSAGHFLFYGCARIFCKMKRGGRGPGPRR